MSGHDGGAGMQENRHDEEAQKRPPASDEE
jgi:hypothetical protein